MPDDLFKQAQEHIQAGQLRKAKELLTRLLRADQNNADYWVWMSTAVETEKEQIFCLQKALKLDPNSIAARRGLVTLGAMRPEDAALPPARALEDIQIEIPKLKQKGGFRDFWARPRNREMVMIYGAGFVILAVVIGVIIWAWPLIFKPVQVVVIVPTRTPEGTLTPGTPTTPTPTSAVGVAPQVNCPPPSTAIPSTPLAVYLCLTQTPTAMPVSTEKSNQEAFTSLQKYYQEGNWGKVIAAADTAIRWVPDNPRVYFYTAEAYRHTGNTAKAITNYNLAISKDKNFAAAYWGKALIEFKQNQANAALDDLAIALRADPAFAPAYLDRASYYLENGNYQRALADLTQAKTVAPGNAEVLATLALAYAESNQPSAALEAAEQALITDPGLALGYYARGIAEYGLADYEKADADLSLSYQYVLMQDALYPKLFQATVFYHYGLGKTGIGEDDKALAAFSQALTLYTDYPITPLYVVRGNIYLRQEKYEEAKTDFNKAINQYQDKNDDRLAEAYLGNGQAWLGLDKPDSALTNFQVAARDMPDNIDAQLGMGICLFRTGEFGKALDSLNAAEPLAKTTAQKAQVYYWRARAFKALGRTAEEVADLTALAEITDAPDHLAPTAQARLTEIGPLATATSAATFTPTPTVKAPAATKAKATAATTPKGALTPTPPSATVAPTKTASP